MADPYKNYKKKLLQHAADKADPEIRDELEAKQVEEEQTDEKSTPEQIQDFFNRLRGRNPEKEAAIKNRADTAAAEYEKTNGPVPEEPGIEEDYTLEDTASLAFGGPAAAMGKRALGMAAREATRRGAKKLTESKPMFSDAVGAGEAKPGATNFAKFIRPENKPTTDVARVKDALKKLEMPEAPKQGTLLKAGAQNDPGRVQALQKQMQQASSQGTRAGDQQAKELLQEIRRLRDPRFKE